MQKKYLSLLIQSAILSGIIIAPASAALCESNSTTVHCHGPGLIVDNIGNGKGASNTTVTVDAGTTLDGGNRQTISLDNQNTLLIEGTVQNTALPGSSGLLNAGANTIEVISNSTITVGSEGKVLSNGTSSNAEAINVMGFGNTIINHGEIRSSNDGAALWFQDDERSYGPPLVRNRVENHGVIARGDDDNGTGAVFGTSSSSGGAGIVFINHSNSKVIGSLTFGQGDDDLEFYSNSVVTGNIDGGGGKNNLTLNGSTGSQDSLRGDISNFTTLTKDGEGRWDVTGSLKGFTEVVVNQGTLGLSGDNTRYNGMLVINPEGNNDATATVEAPARSLPTLAGKNVNNVVNNGILRFDQDKDESYVGQITGSGQVIKTGEGMLTLNPDATDGNLWSGGTSIQQGAIALSQDKQLGADSGALSLDGGGIVLNEAFDLASTRAISVNSQSSFIDTQAWNTTINQEITGSGNLDKRGEGMLTLNGMSRDDWSATVQQGTLNVDGAMAGDVTVEDGARLSGSGSVGNTTLQQGALLVVGSETPAVSSDSLAVSRAAVSTPRLFTVNGSLNNNGTLQLYREDDSTLSNRLVVTGDYHGGEGSQLLMNTLLAGNDAPTDLLEIHGSTSGSTGVTISNVGGLGESALNGIKVIDVQGNSRSNVFYQTGRITAGAFDYFLVQKGNHWYLTNTVEEPQPPIDPVIPDEPTPIDPENPDEPPPVDPTTPDEQPPIVDITDPVTPPDFTGPKAWRPEIGGYLANLQAANTLFTLTLDDREGGTEYFDPLTGELKKTAMWLRQEGGHQRFSSGGNQIKTQANRYVVQLGGELANGSFREDDRWDVGVMAGYANQQANSHSTLTGYSARSTIYGYSAGLYATWFEHAGEKTGWYLDSWAQYNWFDNDLHSQNQASESWKSRGVTASLEAGHIWKLTQNERQALYIQPQAQAIWMGVKNPHNLTDAQGGTVQDINDGNLQTRLGVRLYIKGHSAQDAGKQREFKPFVEANWLHNTERFGVRLNGDGVSMDGTRNIAQFKLGVQGQLTPSLNIWGGTAVQIGDHSYSDTSAMLGLKYRF